MKEKIKSPLQTRLGILGGGQLARFLSLKAQEMGLNVRLLCQEPDEPAALVTKDVHFGNLSDPEVRQKFLDQVDVVTFESEFIDASSIENLKLQNFKVFPSVSTMNLIRDRFTQKDLLIKNKIPTAEIIHFESKNDIIQWFTSNKAAFVLKKRLFGYDGYGTIIVKTKKDLDEIPNALSLKDWIAEKFCPFKRELAFSIARSEKNEFYTLPLVETKQTSSKCDWVKGPIKLKKIEPLLNQFKKMMKKMNYVGLLSVELFETSKGLVVNELAPRVHNSGHYSIEALQVSQFEAHLRAVLGWPLPNAPLVCAKGFSMANLIGSDVDEVYLSPSPDGFLHWYNKSLNKPGRKMGHLTVLDSNSEKALKSALHWRKKFCL